MVRLQKGTRNSLSLVTYKLRTQGATGLKWSVPTVGISWSFARQRRRLRWILRIIWVAGSTRTLWRMLSELLAMHSERRGHQQEAVNVGAPPNLAVPLHSPFSLIWARGFDNLQPMLVKVRLKLLIRDWLLLSSAMDFVVQQFYMVVFHIMSQLCLTIRIVVYFDILNRMWGL